MSIYIHGYDGFDLIYIYISLDKRAEDFYTEEILKSERTHVIKS